MNELTNALATTHHDFIAALALDDGDVALNCAFSSIEDLFAETADVTPELSIDYALLFTTAIVAADSVYANY
ncbi:hypothetical protein SEA_TROJE_36 [Gordonia phage Troje]|uniref:Uncharacterized protein n=1 Tax=Gordonia phage Troje TaxID=2079282 RepID=A0A2K9VEP3_9CAUD|nr:hypothetical protein FDJ27_gp36 [Gordonia phage Troje]AUV60742.1 hypothetical protein SEA_TROJE_36 [Gordonia phage Troje]